MYVCMYACLVEFFEVFFLKFKTVFQLTVNWLFSPQN